MKKKHLPHFKLRCVHVSVYAAQISLFEHNCSALIQELSKANDFHSLAPHSGGITEYR